MFNKEIPMTKNLELPLEYNELADYFDELQCSNNTHTINQVIETILKKYHVKNILDLTCGTGAQVFFLTEHGYQITGSDFSPKLIAIAKQKAKTKNLNLTFLIGDMRSIQVGSFDAVITIANAIGHLTKPDFEIALKNIASNLNPGGIYIFDIFNLECLTQELLESFTLDYNRTHHGTTVHHHQYSIVDTQEQRLISHDKFTLQRNGNKPKILIGKIELQIYKAKELKQILERNNFKILELTDIAGSPFIPATSKNILIVAQKI